MGELEKWETMKKVVTGAVMTVAGIVVAGLLNEKLEDDELVGKVGDYEVRKKRK